MSGSLSWPALHTSLSRPRHSTSLTIACDGTHFILLRFLLDPCVIGPLACFRYIHLLLNVNLFCDRRAWSMRCLRINAAVRATLRVRRRRRRRRRQMPKQSRREPIKINALLPVRPLQRECEMEWQSGRIVRNDGSRCYFLFRTDPH